MTRAYLTVVPSARRSLREWQRDRHLQIFAELSALRLDLKRLQRQTQQVAPCFQCRVRQTIYLADDGNFICKRCDAARRIA